MKKSTLTVYQDIKGYDGSSIKQVFLAQTVKIKAYIHVSYTLQFGVYISIAFFSGPFYIYRKTLLFVTTMCHKLKAQKYVCVSGYIKFKNRDDS